MTKIKYERVKLNPSEVEAGNGEEIEMKLETQIRKPKKHHQYITAAIEGRKQSNFISTVVVTTSLVLCYFILSIGLTFYQRTLLKDFHYPLSVVSYHLIIKCILAALCRFFYKCITKKARVILDFRTSFRKISPTGLASGIDIGFSNWGLELVNISLYTMTKSTVIIFILFFAILLKLEKKSFSLVLIVVMISSGLCMFTYKATEFNALGFSFLLFASFSSGIRWTFAQLIMQKSKLGLHNPIDMIYYMQPWMFISILPFAIGFEGQTVWTNFNLGNIETDYFIAMWMKISIGAFLAFAMEISEYLLLTNTSSLTLSVTGIFKEICQLVLAVEFLGDQMSLVNALGLVMCLGGICCHVVHKFWTYTDTQVTVTRTSDYDDNDDDENDGGNFYKNIKFNQAQLSKTASKNFKSQSAPLLSDEDDSSSPSKGRLNAVSRHHVEEDDENSHPNTSGDVLFDIIKRRER